MESRGDVLSIKFSPDKRILGVQRSQKSVVSMFVLKLCWSTVNSEIYAESFLLV
jgi:hypothetical protein